ncbi:MAG TPA: NAD(P)/FAD-dependent oxidoreductase [Silvibacterium sp.]|jgi:2-polyprenyl-6-methoxyphenol hydroxylase-like FAD-dependent oxidoreductase|nr:NAD(P)/FAD-dependent oxidoreductase [Silvibacterium sp.]
MSKLNVLVIGGGIGGLCLAQGLKKAGVKVAVYERDETPTSRLQGFRVHIDPQGSIALHECLPPELWMVFDSTGGAFGRGFTIITEQLKELLRFTGEDDGSATQQMARHRSVSRITLRRILLRGLDDIVHFNKRFVRYERAGDRIVAHFEDGSTAEGDVLIAADGVNSRVRQQYLPHAEPVDTGVTILGGKVPLTDGALALLPPPLLDGPLLVMPPEAASLFMAVWKRELGRDRYLRLLGTEDTPEDDDYVILGFGAPREYFGFRSDPATLRGAELKDVLRRKVLRWHPALRKLVELLDESELAPTRIRTSEPVEAWTATRVTLLGDAIHSMTPYRGIGANIALKDAALLCAKLTEADREDKPVVTAIGEYEAAMREYGFAAVASSLRSMKQATGEKRFGFGAVKTAMRVMNAVPALRRRALTA